MYFTKDNLPNDKSVSSMQVSETDFLGTSGGRLVFNFPRTEFEQCVVS